MFFPPFFQTEKGQKFTYETGLKGTTTTKENKGKKGLKGDEEGTSFHCFRQYFPPTFGIRYFVFFFFY